MTTNVPTICFDDPNCVQYGLLPTGLRMRTFRIERVEPHACGPWPYDTKIEVSFVVRDWNYAWTFLQYFHHAQHVAFRINEHLFEGEAVLGQWHALRPGGPPIVDLTMYARESMHEQEP